MTQLSTNIPLKDQRCQTLIKGNTPMIIPRIETLLTELDDWEIPLDYKTLVKTFPFKNYHQTVAFVNAVTWVAHKEDHHPEICFGYNQCQITLTTASVKGLSENDFILAAKIDALLD